MGRAISRNDLRELLTDDGPGIVPANVVDAAVDRIVAQIRALDPCYGKAIEDQAVIFVLKDTDPLAAPTVEGWAMVAEKHGHSADKAADALEVARAMRERAARGGKAKPTGRL